MNGSDVKATVVRCGTASLVTHAVSLELLIHFDKWMFVWVSVSSDYTYHDYTYHDWFNAWWFTCESAASWGRLLHWSRIPRSLVTFFFLPLKQTCTPSQIDRFRLKTAGKLFARYWHKAIFCLSLGSSLAGQSWNLSASPEKRSNSAHSRVRLIWVFFLSLGCEASVGRLSSAQFPTERSP